MNSKRWGLLGILAVFMALLMAGPASNVVQAQAARVPVLIAFDHQPGPSEEALVRGAGGNIKYTYTIVPAIAASLPEGAIAGLLNNPNVVRIEDDIEVHLIDHDTTEGDEELDNTWGVKHIGTGAVHAGGNRGSGVKVGVIDSGIDTNHPDLNYDPSCSANFVSGETIEDGNSHGTHTAGTVAALDNGNGVVGVAPNVTLCIYKVLSNSGSGSYSNVIKAIEQAVADGVQITNNSYGSSGDPGQTVKAAFDNAYAAGVLHVAAAGNSGNPKGKGNNCIYPARWDSLIATAATMENDNRASFSSTCDKVELAAPGYRVNSTVPDDSYAEYSGTSMASPHVAGTAALVIAANPSWSNDQVRSQLQTTADDLGDAGLDPQYGYGLVDADEAAAPSSPPADTTAPTVTGVTPVHGANDVAVDSSVAINFSEPVNGVGGTTFMLSAGGVDIPSTVTVATDRLSATLDPGAGLANETLYAVTVTTGVIDDAGNAMVADFTSGFTTASPPPADTTAPTVTGVTPVDGAIDVAVDSSVVINFSEPVNGVDGTTFKLSAGGVDIPSTVTVTADRLSATLDPDAGLANATLHVVTVTTGVTDDAGNAMVADFTSGFTTASLPDSPTTVSVASVTYATEGGKFGDKHLSVTIALVDNLGNPVAGASVSIDLVNPPNTWTGTGGITGAGGTVTYKLKNSPSGCYITTVTDVTAGGLTWDGLTPGNEKCK